MHNLVSNALKFTPAGSVHLAVEADNPDRVRIIVTDTGIGLTPEQAEAAFRPFEQLGTTAAQRQGGTGLGLAIVRTVAEAMGGRVGVSSRPGEGSVFTVDLPLDVPKGDQPAKKAAAPEAQVAGLRVLSVDDSEVNRMVMAALLSSLGAQPAVAEGGEQALMMLEEDAGYDAILLDMIMPGMDGEQTLVAIRALERRLGRRPLPVVACTANAMPEQVRRSTAAGFDGHLAKPVRADTLRSALGAAMFGHARPAAVA